MPNFIQKNKRLLSFWLLGCMHIAYYGLKGNPYRAMYHPDEVAQYPLGGVLFSCGLFSVYFVFTLFSQKTLLKNYHPFVDYLIGFITTGGLLLLALLGAMHAPPYWGAYTLNSALLFLYQLLCIPTLFKKSQ